MDNVDTQGMHLPHVDFTERLLDRSCGVLPAPTEAQEALDVLTAYLLPELVVVPPLTQKQVNTVIVQQLLMKHSGSFRQQARAAGLIDRDELPVGGKRNLAWFIRELEEMCGSTKGMRKSILEEVLKLARRVL